MRPASRFTHEEYKYSTEQVHSVAAHIGKVDETDGEC